MAETRQEPRLEERCKCTRVAKLGLASDDPRRIRSLHANVFALCPNHTAASHTDNLTFGTNPTGGGKSLRIPCTGVSNLRRDLQDLRFESSFGTTRSGVAAYLLGS